MRTPVQAVLLAGLICGLAGAPETSNAAGLPEYQCYRLPAAPTRDGELGDGVWQRVPEATGSRVLSVDPNVREYALAKQTSFRAARVLPCKW